MNTGFWWETPEGRIPPGRPWLRRKDDAEIDVRDVG